MKRTLLIILTLFSVSLFSQNWDTEQPEYKQIEKQIKKRRSNLYYKNLMNRYLEADTSMTVEEKRHLYYGYIFQKDYSPYASSNYADSLKVIFQKEKYDSLDLENIVKFTDIMIEENPFNLRAINYQLFSLEKLGRQEQFNMRFLQLSIVEEAIMSSGSGLSTDKAFYVTHVSHEYYLVEMLGFQFRGSQNLIEHYDYLELEQNQYGIEGLYFDVTPCLNHLNK